MKRKAEDCSMSEKSARPPPSRGNNNNSNDISIEEKVTIRVGGGGRDDDDDDDDPSPFYVVKTYEHTKLFLVHSSEYFDAMFRCQMKETNDGVIDFPDDDPTEWELIQPFLELGMTQPAVTTKNVFKLLLWNEKLLMKHDRVKGACSQMLSQKVKGATSVSLDEETTNMVVFILKLGIRFHLDDIVTLTTKSLERVIGKDGAHCFLRGVNGDDEIQEDNNNMIELKMESEYKETKKLKKEIDDLRNKINL